MEKIVEQIAKEYKAALQELYGNDLAELVLFGSYARGDQHDESDVDFAVVFLDNHPRTLEDKMKISSLGLIFPKIRVNGLFTQRFAE
jgi:uncharacterized protein